MKLKDNVELTKSHTPQLNGYLEAFIGTFQPKSSERMSYTIWSYMKESMNYFFKNIEMVSQSKIAIF